MASAPPLRRPVRERIIRDPVHGDISVGPLQCLVVDTVAFQRLRYIRQTGLLHFVFPGAVHTRFAHSIGTMWNARRLLDRLFPKSQGPAREYVGECFQVAALTHDIGHCAFSHAIEGVSVANRPLFAAPQRLVEQWSAEDDVSDELKRRWAVSVASLPATAPHATHEEIGQLLVEAIFRDDAVLDYCEQRGFDAGCMASDVRALLSKATPASQRLDRAFRALLNDIDERPPQSSDEAHASADLLALLRSFISGTLDVDRLDYLARDSHYTGTCYGRCDSEVLLNGLGVGWSDDGRLRPVLRERALDALDDMLWSRFQLFQQVMNHKTHVLLNAMLSRAVGEAIFDDGVNLKAPRSLGGYVRFTDDLVMSAVFSHCAGGLGKTKAYGQALVHRILPRHLGVVEREPGQSDAEFDAVVDAMRAARADSAGISLRSVKVWKAKSEIFKADAPAPWIRAKDAHGHVPPLAPYASRSRLYKSLQSARPSPGALALGVCIKAHLYEYPSDEPSPARGA
ncbi:MAG TPA: HD domain-containing protein [Polyangiaceae bacterium]|nr:HD domain-containing protein [Polyangiaceae bacterium]